MSCVNMLFFFFCFASFSTHPGKSRLKTGPAMARESDGVEEDSDKKRVDGDRKKEGAALRHRAGLGVDGRCVSTNRCVGAVLYQTIIYPPN